MTAQRPASPRGPGPAPDPPPVPPEPEPAAAAAPRDAEPCRVCGRLFSPKSPGIAYWKRDPLTGARVHEECLPGNEATESQARFAEAIAAERARLSRRAAPPEHATPPDA